jgi:methionine sulfoxide reductase catalytic subunit
MRNRGDPARGRAARGAKEISPESKGSFRSQLTTGENIVNPTTWAGSIPQVQGIAPRIARRS